MPVGRTASSKPYQLMVFSLRPEGEPAEQDSESYAVFIYDPSLRRPVDTGALRDLEGLTEAEARLCYSLYNTKSLSETAEQLDVSVSTAKTHLLNTFRKLGINSQAELMKYLAHMPKLSATSQH